MSKILSRLMFIMLGAVFTTSCERGQKPTVSSDRPSDQDIILIEQKMEGLGECIGDLRRWQRTYFYPLPTPSSKMDRNRIEFLFERGPGVKVYSKAIAVSPGGALNFDDRNVDSASGYYKKTEGKIVLTFCGPNLGDRQDVSTL